MSARVEDLHSYSPATHLEQMGRVSSFPEGKLLQFPTPEYAAPYEPENDLLFTDILKSYNTDPVARQKVNGLDRAVADSMVARIVAKLEAENSSPVSYEQVSGALSKVYSHVRDSKIAGKYQNINVSHFRNLLSSARGSYEWGRWNDTSGSFVPEKKEKTHVKKIFGKAVAGAAAITMAFSQIFGQKEAHIPTVVNLPVSPVSQITSFTHHDPFERSSVKSQEDTPFLEGETSMVTMINPDGSTEELGELNVEFVGTPENYLQKTGNNNPGPDATNGLTWIDYGSTSFGLAHTALKEPGSRTITYGPLEKVRELIAAGKQTKGVTLKFRSGGKVRTIRLGDSEVFKKVDGGLNTIAKDPGVIGRKGFFLCSGFELFDPANNRLGRTNEWSFTKIESDTTSVAQQQQVYGGVIFTDPRTFQAV